MHHVHHFKANFSQEEPATHPQPDSLADALILHEADSSVRNLCLIWDDGRKAFFNYAYLVTVDFTVQDEFNVLLLSFGAYTVIVKGYNLGSLFDQLMEHAPKIITAVNPRYIIQTDVKDGVVVEILVKSE